jgi:thioredoxin 1
MTEDTDIEDIRAKKREQLRQQTDGDQSAESESPDEPVSVAGADELSELVASQQVVLADFYADWCGPCKMMEPVVERIAADTEAAVAKVDVDANQSLAAQYGVRGVPTFVLFADGEAVDQFVGGQDESRLRSLVQQQLN